MEVDFIATTSNEKIYYQVSATIAEQDSRERELRPLLSINDNYEKVILTMDKTTYNDFEGIKCMNLLDFLLGIK